MNIPTSRKTELLRNSDTDWPDEYGLLELELSVLRKTFDQNFEQYNSDAKAKLGRPEEAPEPTKKKQEPVTVPEGQDDVPF